MSKGTTHRTVRIESALWERAGAKAAERGESISEVIRRALELYADGRHPTWSSEVNPVNNAHIANCPECQANFGGAT